MNTYEKYSRLTAHTMRGRKRTCMQARCVHEGAR